MPSATVLFQPGWTHFAAIAGEDDPITGEASLTFQATPGTGLVQQISPAVSQKETGLTGLTDERMVLFAPIVKVSDRDHFTAPDGTCYNAIATGVPRGIPGNPPEYVAIPVRAAPEYIHERETDTV